MKDPTAQLLLSALAMSGDRRVIAQLRLQAGLVDRSMDALQMASGPPEDMIPQTDVHEVFSPDWPELLVLMPVREDASLCPIVHWEPTFGPGGSDDIN